MSNSIKSAGAVADIVDVRMCEMESEPLVRTPLDTELNFYRDRGWVFLSHAVSSAKAAELLAEAKMLVSRAQKAHAAGRSDDEDFWFSWSNSVFEARYMNRGPFVDLARSDEMGRIASKLINALGPEGDPVAVRSLGGNLFCKMGSKSTWSGKIPFHQDAPSFNVRCPGFVTIWVALDEVGADQGGMRFLDGSHRIGALADHRSGFPLDRHPELLEKYPVTSPLHYAPGDASAHDGFMLHGSDENCTDLPRWGYACLYAAADVAFDDSAYEDRPHGFRPPLERYPIVYDGRV